MNEIKAERLILMAAGRGSRLAPLTDVIPKPLIKVKGKRMIDYPIQAALNSGIKEIIVVRGYKAPCFQELLEDYPMVTFIENDYYDQGNNIVSVYLAREFLSNAYLAEADLVLNASHLISPTQTCSNYLGVRCDHTNDWAFETSEEENGCRITSVLPSGGEDVHHMYGISFWTSSEAARLKEELEVVVEQRHEIDRYFEEVPLNLFSNKHHIFVRPCDFTDVVEIDTLADLEAYDPEWRIHNHF